MSLDEIRSRWQAATPGPWFLDEGGDTGVYTERRASDTSRDVASAFRREDEVAIAHAPSDVARLLAAVEAVLVQHKVERRWMTHEGADESYDSEDEAREWMDEDEPEGQLPFFEVCAECKRVEEGPCDGECPRELGYRESMWPCPTVKALTAALEGNR